MVMASGPYCLTGSWRYKIPKLRHDVAKTVKEESLNKGRKLIVGGALEADFIATKVLLNGLESLEGLEKFLEIHIPAQTLGDYLAHYGKKFEDGEISYEQATTIPKQLYKLNKDHPKAFVFLQGAREDIGRFNYYRRIMQQVENSTELRAFQVGDSQGVGFAIDYALQKDIPVHLERYPKPENKEDIEKN
jgi:hypothetical protein